jgi:hypothetical protein
MFILRLCEHLSAHGVPVPEICFQTDNGTEFTTTWNSLEKSAFTTAIEQVLSARHITIPPGAKTWQSDVETSHRLIEDEFYAGERPVNISGFSLPNGTIPIKRGPRHIY